MSEKFIESSWSKKDIPFETPLRPKTLDDFLGQENVRQRLQVFIRAAKERNESLSHLLFHGPPGLGKTTLAQIIANEMGSRLVTTSGPIIEKAGDLAGILTNLKEGDVLFIDEIHRLNASVEEYLYPAMEDFALDLVIDSGPAARSVQVTLSRFTLVGATTRTGLLSSPLRDRFGFACRLDYYTPEVLEKIVQRSARLLALEIHSEGAREIASRSRGTPRIANHLLRWVRDFAQVQKKNIDRKVVVDALEMLSIDEKGLDEMDKKILSHMIDYHDGGPVGLSTLAAALGEEASTLAEVYEPYLLMQGFLRRTLRGREATDQAYIHLKKIRGE